VNSLPKSDVLKYLMEGDCSVVVRPSGTEPTLKVYINTSAKTKEEAAEIENKISSELGEFFR
jgi:phosphoglucomutase